MISPESLLTNHEALINSLDDPMWSVDKDLCLITVNNGYRELISLFTGKAPEPGDPVLLTVFGEEMKNKWHKYYLRALGGEKFYVTEEIQLPDSKLVEFNLISFNPLYNDRSQITGAACYAKTVTEETRHRQAEQAVKEELSKILDSSMDMICTINEHGEFSKVSAASLTILGYTPGELIGKAYIDFVHPDDIEKTMQADKNIKAGRDTTHFENRYLRKDGISIPVIWSARWDNREQILYCVARDASENKKAAQEMQLLINNTEESFVLLDKNLKIISFNSQFHLLYKKYFNKLVERGMSIIDYAQPERQDTARAIYKRVLQGNVETAEITLPLPDGQTRIFTLKYKPALDENQEIMGAFVTIKDTTDDALVKQALVVSNERYVYATTATSDAIWDWDIVTGNLYWGEGFHTLFGYDLRDQNVGITSWTDHIHPGDSDRVVSGIHTLIDSTETNWIDEYRYRKKDDTYAYVIDKGYVIRDTQGNAIRMVGAMRDITDRKQEELRLKLLESVITHTTDGIMIAEADTSGNEIPRIIFVNDAFTAMTGYESGEVIGKSPTFPYGPRTDRRELRRLYKALETHHSCKVELLCYRKNGDSFWMNMTITPVTAKDGTHTHWIAVQRDVTARKTAEVALKEKNKELKRLSAYLQQIREEERKHIAREVHDELGQLASALKIDIDWLTLKTAPAENAVTRLTHANNTIAVLIKSIREIASRLRPSVLDDLGLHAALKWHCSEFEKLNGISCNFDPRLDDSLLPDVWKTELFRMVQESLTNVMRHANATKVNVITREDMYNFYLTIKDNGEGFNTGEKKSTLGLIGLRERVLSLNGELNIDSMIGKGTTINIVIPKIKNTVVS